MMIKRLIALLILSATIFSMFGCDAIKNGGGHKTPDETDNTETPENQVITYVYSVSSGSFHLEGCSYIKEIKEKSHLIPVTKTADYKGDEMFEKDVLSTDFASLCSSDVTKRICGMDYVTSPYVKK